MFQINMIMLSCRDVCQAAQKWIDFMYQCLYWCSEGGSNPDAMSHLKANDAHCQHIKHMTVVWTKTLSVQSQSEPNKEYSGVSGVKLYVPGHKAEDGKPSWKFDLFIY